MLRGLARLGLRPLLRNESTVSCSTSYACSKGLASEAASLAANRPDLQTQSRTPTAPHGPLTVRYPFSIEYLKDREMLLYDLARRPIGVESLPGACFNVPVRIDILHRVVRYLRAKWQQGTHKAKVTPHACTHA